jgi:hypothetical protein
LRTAAYHRLLPRGAGRGGLTISLEGGVVFVSSRCRRWVNCWTTQVAVLYRCDGDGRNLRPLSSNNEHDNTPWPLDQAG